MSTTQVGGGPSAMPGAGSLGMKLEVVVIPVSDVDRAKAFYEKLGWRLDADFALSSTRLVQFTPPGSGCSIQFGTNITTAKPGSARDLYLVIPDIEAARDDLVHRGVGVSEIFHCTKGFGCAFRDPPGDGRESGPDPKHSSYGSFATFTDPDGNEWLFQEVTTRLPGRMDRAVTTFSSPQELAGAFRRAETAHRVHEKALGHRDENWPEWYAEFMVREQAGEDLPT